MTTDSVRLGITNRTLKENDVFEIRCSMELAAASLKGQKPSLFVMQDFMESCLALSIALPGIKVLGFEKTNAGTPLFICLDGVFTTGNQPKEPSAEQQTIQETVLSVLDNPPDGFYGAH